MLQRTRSFLRRSVATEPALAAALVGFGTCQTLGVRQRPAQAAGGRAAQRTGFARERVVAGRPSTPLFSTSESNIVVPVEVLGYQQRASFAETLDIYLLSFFTYNFVSLRQQ